MSQKREKKTDQIIKSKAMSLYITNCPLSQADGQKMQRRNPEGFYAHLQWNKCNPDGTEENLFRGTPQSEYLF